MSVQLLAFKTFMTVPQSAGSDSGSSACNAVQGQFDAPSPGGPIHRHSSFQIFRSLQAQSIYKNFFIGISRKTDRAAFV